MKRNSAFYRLARGAIWTSLNNATNRLFLLASSIILARVLGKDQFGLFSMGRSTLNLFQLFSGFGLSLTATKYVSELREKNQFICGHIATFVLLSGLVSGFLSGSILFLGGPFFARVVLNNNHLTPLLRISAIILAIGTLPGIINGILLGLESFPIITILGLFSSISLLVFTAAGSLFWGTTGAFWGLALSSISVFILSFPILLKRVSAYQIPFPVIRLTEDVHLLWEFALPSFLSGGVLTISSWVLYALLVQTPNGYQEMAILTAVVAWRGPLIFIPSVLKNAFFPILSNFLGKGEIRRFKKAILLQIFTVSSTTLLGTITVISLAPFLMGLFGKTFKGNFIPLNWIALSAIPMAITMVFDRVFQSTGRMWLGLSTSLAWAGVLIGCSIYFLDQGKGALGIAQAFCIAYSCHMVWQGVIVFFLVKNLGKDPKVTPVKEETL